MHSDLEIQNRYSLVFSLYQSCFGHKYTRERILLGESENHIITQKLKINFKVD